jgi:hypothetical protein
MLRFPKRRAPGLTDRYLFFNTLLEHKAGRQRLRRVSDKFASL